MMQMLDLEEFQKARVAKTLLGIGKKIEEVTNSNANVERWEE